MMSTFKNAHKCMEVYYTQYNIITYIHITHICMIHLGAMNSEIPFALDGLVAIIGNRNGGTGRLWCGCWGYSI